MTQQQPIGSGFGASTTASEAIRGIDLSGKIAIVTGGYSGIGLETTRALRSAGAQVIVPARDLDKAATHDDASAEPYPEKRGSEQGHCTPPLSSLCAR